MRRHIFGFTAVVANDFIVDADLMLKDLS